MGTATKVATRRPADRSATPAPLTTEARAGWIVNGVILFVLVFLATWWGPFAIGAVLIVGVAAVIAGRLLPDRAATGRRLGLLCAIVGGLNIVLVVLGVPFLRAPVWELQRVADKIEAGCWPGAADVDLWRGGIVASAAPISGANQLTPAEERLLVVNAKVGCVPGPIR